jgi:uncharacterized Tic20 family protein
MQQSPNPNVMDRSTERALSAAAHAAIAFGLFGITFIMSLAISGVIWLYSRRSPEVRFHAEQAGCYQCSVLLINVVCVVGLLLSGGLAIVKLFEGQGDWAAGLGRGTIIGLILFAVWFFGTILVGVIAAVSVLMGKRFKYPIIGDRFDKPGTRD